MALFARSAAPTIVETPVPASTATIAVPPPSSSRPAIPTQQAERQNYLQQMKVRIHQQLVTRLDMQNLRTLPPATVREEVRALVRELCY